MCATVGAMITVDGLTKRYGTTEVLHSLSFSVPDGQVTGFVGPNGSGKSSTLRCMLGLDRPNSGEVLYDGEPLAGPDRSRIVGALLSPTWYMPVHSARTHIHSIAQAAGLPTSRADECLELVGLQDVARKRIRTFSLGMKQRLGLAVALLGDPAHLLLDEPINGLDPQGVHWMRSLIRRYADEGRAVLVSSHLLAELEQTADRVVLIGQGSVLGEHGMAEFLTQANGGVATVALRAEGPDGRPVTMADIPTGGEGGDMPQLGATDGTSAGGPHAVLVHAATTPDELARVVGTVARDRGWIVLDMRAVQVGLEQRYLDVTQQSVQFRAGGAA